MIHKIDSSLTQKLQLTIFVSHHVLHTDADLSIAVEGAIEAHNIGRVAFMQDLQFSDNLVSDGRFDFQVDQLTRKNTETKYCFN